MFEKRTLLQSSTCKPNTTVTNTQFSQQWLESMTVVIYCLSSQSGRVNVRALSRNQFETNSKYYTVKRPELQ